MENCVINSMLNQKRLKCVNDSKINYRDDIKKSGIVYFQIRKLGKMSWTIQNRKWGKLRGMINVFFFKKKLTNNQIFPLLMNIL